MSEYGSATSTALRSCYPHQFAVRPDPVPEIHRGEVVAGTAIDHVPIGTALGEDVSTKNRVAATTTVEMILAKAAAMEKQSAADYNRAAAECAANQDSMSKQMFEALVGDEERHFDEFDLQMDHIKRFGPSYLALQSFQRTPQGSESAE